MAALERLKARRAGARPTAAGSHHQNDAYLTAFDCPGSRPSASTAPPRCVAGGLPLAGTLSKGFGAGDSSRSSVSLMQEHAGAAAQISAPQQPPTCISLADRNLLCASVDWQRQEAVLGSADHALYCLDLQRRKKARTLYTKTSGHREWVTAVCHLPADGRVVSGGMDSRICLWTAAGGAAVCKDLEGHTGPISQLESVPAAPSAFVSAGYDKRLITWSGGSGLTAVRQQQVLSGHRAPVLQLRVHGSVAASGDRDGAVLRWDLAAGAAAGKPLPAHTGHCTSLEWWSNSSCSGSGCDGSSSGNGAAGASTQPLLVSGGQDGWVRVWDGRAGQPLAQQGAHTGPAGKGAVGSIAAGLPGADHLVVTAGADCTVQGLDSRRNLQAAWSVALPDIPYTMAAGTAASSRLFCGCGNGSIAVIDAAAGSLAYTLQASQSAVRTVHVGPGGALVAGCDDGAAVVYAPE